MTSVCNEGVRERAIVSPNKDVKISTKAWSCAGLFCLHHGLPRINGLHRFFKTVQNIETNLDHLIVPRVPLSPSVCNEGVRERR